MLNRLGFRIIRWMDTNEGLLFLVWVLFGTGSIIGLTIYGLVHVL